VDSLTSDVPQASFLWALKTLVVLDGRTLLRRFPSQECPFDGRRVRACRLGQRQRIGLLSAGLFAGLKQRRETRNRTLERAPSSTDPFTRSIFPQQHAGANGGVACRKEDTAFAAAGKTWEP
jgi:hypothetical protein